MNRFVLNISVSFVSIILSMVILEGVIRFHYSQHLNYDYEMWRYAAELKAPLVGPLLPFHHKAGKSGNFYGVELRTNSKGFRDVEFTEPKPAGIKRILMLGDSFTLGWGVSAEATFSKRLEKLIRTGAKGSEVVNMGVGNYNSVMEVELFKRKGLALKPDIIVLMYYINDTEPTPQIGGISYPLLKHFYLPAYVRTKLTQLGMMNSSTDWLQAYYKNLYAPDSAGLHKATESIQELIKIAAEKQIKLLIVNIPDLRRLKGYPFEFATSLPRGLAENGSLPFLDLLPFFRSHEGKALWVSDEDSHMNSLANSIAAQAIYQKMIDEKMLD